MTKFPSEYGAQTHSSVVEDAADWCRALWGDHWTATGNRTGTWCVFWGGHRDSKMSASASKHAHWSNTYQWWFATEEQQTLFVLKWT